MYNHISDIDVLEEVKFEKLEFLNLSGNRINENNFSSLIDILKSKFDFQI